MSVRVCEFVCECRKESSREREFVCEREELTTKQRRGNKSSAEIIVFSSFSLRYQGVIIIIANDRAIVVCILCVVESERERESARKRARECV